MPAQDHGRGPGDDRAGSGLDVSAELVCELCERPTNGKERYFCGDLTHHIICEPCRPIVLPMGDKPDGPRLCPRSLGEAARVVAALREPEKIRVNPFERMAEALKDAVTASGGLPAAGTAEFDKTVRKAAKAMTSFGATIEDVGQDLHDFLDDTKAARKAAGDDA